ncbi:hypothetical protein JOQ06_028535 [Pogonophryne albipinna]|uniref:Uncharacterized protein n=1 Tax=Pogonophryne albipinna TaxID=1090488 RepID=A0AAD6FMK5_9TELE|nr:hypothetical protein JOQ06_028535 [Pogonophryne albipinna]
MSPPPYLPHPDLRHHTHPQPLRWPLANPSYSGFRVRAADSQPIGRLPRGADAALSSRRDFLHLTRPLRAAGSGRSLLRRSELITCILDRRATWGHTLPEDRSIHAGGNKGTWARGLKPGARSRVGAGQLNCKRSRGETGWMLGHQLHEPEGQGSREGAQRGVRGRDLDPGGKGRVRVSDRGLHGPAEALLIHGRVELTAGSCLCLILRLDEPRQRGTLHAAQGHLLNPHVQESTVMHFLFYTGWGYGAAGTDESRKKPLFMEQLPDAGHRG